MVLAVRLPIGADPGTNHPTDQKSGAGVDAQLRLRGPDELQPAFRADFAGAGSRAERLRVIVDQVASLTDASAEAWHARLR